ncbi:MAG: hypothetical protein K6C94_03420 [Candidatus Gastranaerophilales bacterium]|nr:hypothetical protein [Candidatus Gastranaerophilales bacterium]
MKKILFSKIFILCFFIIFLILLVFFFEESVFRCGQKYYKNTDFQKAAFCYRLALRYDKILLKLPFSDKKLSDKKIRNLYLKIADCYSESGDISKAITIDGEILSYFKAKNSENEDFINYLEMEMADNYVKLGYFDKAVPIYEKIKDWYPQNLIKLYLFKKEYQKAASILFSGEIQKVMFNGDDIDSATLNYLLLKYYMETESYDEIFDFVQNEDLDFETKLMVKVLLADLFERLEENEKSYNLYEDLLFSPYLKNSSDYVLKIRYANLASKIGKKQEAEELINELEKSQKKLYKYSPQRICTQYYKSKIFHNSSDYKVSVKLFKKLKLQKQSYFYNDLDAFCRINTSI